MKPIPSCTIRLRWLYVGLAAFAASLNLLAADLFVAPSGNDSHSGTKAEPLASLAGARDAIRKLKQGGSLKEAVIVHFSAGTYLLERTVNFTQADSGTETAHITYRAQAGATVRLTGGREVTGWQPVTDQAALGRLAPEARGRVVVADLRAQGITDYGQLKVRGWILEGHPKPNPTAEAELFFNDEPMTLARWPNTGFRGVTAVVEKIAVVVDTDRMSRWTAEAEPWVLGYWRHDWAELYEPIARVDAEKRTLIRTAGINPAFGLKAETARWYAYNLMVELDTPGEYYLDRASGRLYFWPPRDGGRTVLPMPDGLILAQDLSHVTFRGFTIEACRGDAIVLKSGADCHIVGCTIRNTGRLAVLVTGGERHEVYGCDVYFNGSGGIWMVGGKRATLTPARHNAENNHIHHYSRRLRTNKPAIDTAGVGNRIAHNLVHDGPSVALQAGGNDHIVEFNEVHNVVEDSGDGGAYYVGRSWTERGTVLRYNYWHDIKSSIGYGGMTIYLDDQHSGNTIHGNLFERCNRAVFAGGGNDNVVTNNVFLNCSQGAQLDDRGMQWMKAYTADPKGDLLGGVLDKGLSTVPYTDDLWRSRYPTLVNILKDDPGVPKRNVFAGNISAGGKWDAIFPSIRHLQTVKDNLVFDADKDWVRISKDASGRPSRLFFKDAAAVQAIGFVPLPLEKMGAYQDERRASWPIKHVVRQVRLPAAAVPAPKAAPPKKK
ncbi:MAG: right-handed parallel beta-helix repeat-containing protein [Limisphaerales bacterium]